MIAKYLFLAAAIAMTGVSIANAGQVINEGGIIVCAVDKWNETEPNKGHKLVDSAFRCVLIHNGPAASKTTEECVGKYEYMPDQTWKGVGTCTDTYYGGDKIYLSWEEGSHLNPYVYKKTGGTGKYQGVSGGGTYTYQNLTNNLSAGTFQGTVVLP
jgi:hypothetical protein